jgi:hypothetical protein
VTVSGQLHRSLKPHMARYLHAVKVGHAREMERHHEAMRRVARRLPNRDVAEEQLRLIDRVHAAAINPRGARVPYGSTVRVGDEPVRVPITPHESVGRDRGWTATGRFAWLVEPGSLGKDTDARLRQLGTGRRFKLTRTPEGVIVSSREGLSMQKAHSVALEVERQLPQLRRSRVKKRGEPLSDDTPLDPRRDLAVRIYDDEQPGDYSRHHRITREQAGHAGELAIGDVTKRLHELGVIPHARIGDLGVEMKTTPLRGLVGGRRTGTISQEARARKIAHAKAEGLRPAMVHNVVDFDTGRAHSFLHVYQPGEAFMERRLPTEMVGDLVAGKLSPGDEHMTKSGRGERWMYVGTHSLRHNPLDERDQARELTAAERRARLKERVEPADVVEPRPVKGRRPRARSSREDRNRHIKSLAASDPGMTQGEIARQVGVSQATVSNVLREAGMERGRGARTDLVGAR